MGKKLKEAKIGLNGLHCASCIMKIEMELEDLAGVEKAEGNFAQEEVRVEFDEDKIKMNEIIEAIEKLGYKSEVR